MQGSRDIVAYSLNIGKQVLAQRTDKSRKELGQFLTPKPVARYMARQLLPVQDGARILDPAIGSGVLACAMIEQIIQTRRQMEIWIDGYEIDTALANVARRSLAKACEQAIQHGITIHTTIHERDFVLEHASPGPLFDGLPQFRAKYDHIIANPPYFKLNRDDRRVQAVIGRVNGHTNIYTLFIALSLKLLNPTGHACYIVPRSFCSGAYFSAFRQDFIQQAIPISAHIFESRQAVFKDSQVLQENIILSFRPRPTDETFSDKSFHLDVSTSQTDVDLDTSQFKHSISVSQFLARRNGTLLFRLPISELDQDIVNTIDSWEGSLHKYGWEVSTGPVVAFRAREYLADEQSVTSKQAVPLLWMQNLSSQRLEWPVQRGTKPQGLLKKAAEKHLLVPVSNYVLLRRFSAKEDRRRLVAAPLLATQFEKDHTHIGLENHLNYIYRKEGSLNPEETKGLAALLNSALVDRYFRIQNGNTQVNAAELRMQPLPPPSIIQQIGRQIPLDCSTADLDSIVFSVLRETGYLDQDIPTIRETRLCMTKIQQAQQALNDLGLPPAQQNEISALTLLILAQLSEDTPWNDAERPSLRIHDILQEIKERYGREYAENTRETIRRQVIHQFIQAGLVLRNPDEPSLSTNSPRTHYALADAAVQVIRNYGSNAWQQAVKDFSRTRGTLLELYQKSRDYHRIPLRLADGREYTLSPGEHNELQAAIIQEFGPRFAPGSTLFYLGDTENKTLIIEEQEFNALGIPVPSHEKLPDVVLYDKTRNWLYLIEAVTSHGPISPKRQVELEEMLISCTAKPIYVTAFPDLATFKDFLSEIAWETEVWLAEIPDHMIHFNGDRFLQP